jgi:serine/threonine protein kinase
MLEDVDLVTLQLWRKWKSLPLCPIYYWCPMDLLDRNHLVVLDFGLAKELKSRLKVGTDQYKGRSSVGTMRYMAPEVYRGDPYGLPVDVYGAALILWGIMDLRTPFKTLSKADDLVKYVFYDKKRPDIKREWSKKIKRLLKCAWHDDPMKRPKMVEFRDTIQRCF